MSDEFAPRRPGQPTSLQPVNAGTVFAGVALTAGLHVAGSLAIGLLGWIATLASPDMAMIGLIAGLFIGATQLLWMIPAWIMARRRGKRGIALGLVIGASLTVLGNSACFGMFAYGGL